MNRIRAQARATQGATSGTRAEDAGSGAADARDLSRGSLSGDDLLWYVTSWHVSAIMAAVVAPRFRTNAALAKLLGVPSARVQDMTRKLLDRGFLVERSGELLSNLPPRLYLGHEAAGQIFRSAWVQHGIERAQSGYRDGFQRGGVFRASAEEFDALKADCANLYRAFFSEK